MRACKGGAGYVWAKRLMLCMQPGPTLCMQPGPTRSGVDWGGRRGARQAFVDILATNETFAAPMDATYSLLGLSPKDVTTLEQYLQARPHSPPPRRHISGMRASRARSALLRFPPESVQRQDTFVTCAAPRICMPAGSRRVHAQRIAVLQRLSRSRMWLAGRGPPHHQGSGRGSDEAEAARRAPRRSTARPS